MKPYYLAITILSFISILTSCSPKVPRPDHIIIVMEENHGYDEVINSPNAPFITQLAKEGALFTDAHGVTHPSQPNYLAIFSGSTQGVTDDKCLDNETPYTTPNLAASLISKGFTFKGFAHTMPSVGYLDCEYLKSSLTGASLYARKHAPWVNWQGDGTNNIPETLSLPMTSFPKDFHKLPTVAFVIPDMDNDMHNIGAPGDSAAIRRGDQWLKENLEAYAKWAKTHNSLLIVTFDEDDFKPVNHIPTMFIGQMIKPGKYDDRINHYNVLHTIEAMYDLPIADTTNAEAIKGIWK
ncbi:alkaline phosphatase family protein [Mucilaginibacter sabulilitoris]|uniref:Alkaline phosphatase family protein n=1 Tax=Mucilaginibacter sabulilitoris TaxID=1173583 RepID=A0ABZ0TW89_9SPHI|nr:alkaline phosphatase family protein [Mucilaginibacter sabulilitoris]WPU96318.1 alkaline phosphatase family protein [Mucilaginibacter sabulilitoris]